MATPEEYYCRTWFFRSMDRPRAYPSGKPLMIGRRVDSDHFTLAWLDADKVLHVLSDLTLNEAGQLTSSGATDLATGSRWSFTISPSEPVEGKYVISARVDYGNPPYETDLTGSWGADAPPPDPDSGDGRPS